MNTPTAIEGRVDSNEPDKIARRFIDTDCNEQSLFVRYTYFLGANDPYKSLNTTLKAEIDEDALATLNSDTSHPFVKPRSGRIAVMVINHARRRLGSLNTIGAFLNRIRHLRREEIL